MGDIEVRESREAHLKTEKDGGKEAKVGFANMEDGSVYYRRNFARCHQLLVFWWTASSDEKIMASDGDTVLKLRPS